MTNALQDLSDRTFQYIRKHGLIANRDHVLAAVSGGPDSVALLHILGHLKSRAGIDHITVVHFDHRLRGSESDSDREFVRSLAQEIGFDFHCGAADVRAFAEEKRISIEMAARECRHFYFKKMARELGTQKIALGHTANDQAEEVLMRLIRGTGPAGLRGMLPRTGEGIVRPLLFATREEILLFLQEHHILYQNDSSNLEPFCQRNSIRLEVFPLLQKAFHPNVAGTIARFADLACEEESWWATQIGDSWQSICSEQSEHKVSLNLNKLREQHPAFLRRVLREGILRVRGNLSGIGMVHLEALVASVSKDKPGKSIHFPGQIEALQRSGKLIIRKIESGSPALSETTEIAEPGRYAFAPFTFEISLGHAGSPPNPAHPGRDIIFMDASKVKWPLQLRFWKPGDRFHPFGMKGSKKLQDFFIDSRVPREDRKNVPLLCDSEKICWVAGFRMDDRVRTGTDTESILTVRLTRSGSE